MGTAEAGAETLWHASGVKGVLPGAGLCTPGTCGLMAGQGTPLSLPLPPLGLQDQDQLGVLHSILHQKEGEGECVAVLEEVIRTWRHAGWAGGAWGDRK